MELSRGRFPGAEAEEAELVRRAVAGDRRSFDALIRLHSVWMYSVACHIAGTDEAPDLYQEVVVHIMQRLSGFSGRSKLSTWLRAVVRNYSLNWLRSRRRNLTILMSESELEAAADGLGHDEVPDPAALFDSVEREREVRRALSRLSPAAQRAITMRFYLDMEYKEIAMALGATPDAVRMLVNRALRVLSKDSALEEALVNA